MWYSIFHYSYLQVWIYLFETCMNPGLSFSLTENSGYPLEPWLLTPVLGDPDASTSKGQYKGKHRSMRSFVERRIGVLKSKFRCLQRFRTMLYSPEQCKSFMRALLSTTLPWTRATGHWKSLAGECHQLSSQGTDRRWNRETCSSEEGSSAVLLWTFF